MAGAARANGVAAGAAPRAVRAAGAGGDRNSVQAVERAVDLLLALAAAPQPPTLRELSQSLAVSPSTVLRLLTALEKKGLVERDPRSRRFGLGVRILALAAGRSRQADLHTRALPHMRALRDRSGETVILQVLAGQQHVCVAEVEGLHEVRRRVAVGQVFPVDRGTTAKVFRAFGPEMPNAAPPEPPSADGLPRTLAEVRAAGYAVGVEEREPGGSAMSAPVFDADGRVWAALTIAAPAQRFGPAEMRPLAAPLKAAAAAISLELGYQGAAAFPQPAVVPAGDPARGES
ncbi:MAG TPA: IclR family transcriptional regulator [Chloroflexota bacterium]|nr:IclR family transcriptional regulator [Chloroflexota bacterium]